MITQILKSDNGYFEVVELDCGHRLRIETEHIQFGVTEEKRRRNREAEAAAGPCPTCARG